MRLINEDAVMEIIERVTNEAVEKKQPKYLIQPRIIAEISGLPTIEAESVKHGRWENDKLDIPRCSCCSYIPEFNRHIDDYYYSDFCPNCGARMDLKENDEDGTF